MVSSLWEQTRPWSQIFLDVYDQRDNHRDDNDEPDANKNDLLRTQAPFFSF